MCYRLHDLDHQREKAASTPRPSSLHAWTGERWAAFMAWLRPSAKAAVPVATTSLRHSPSWRGRGENRRHLIRPPPGQAPTPEARGREAEMV
jgi:hypothetical protein